MNKNKLTVQKALTDEEKAIIENIKSLVSQLEQLETAEAVDEKMIEETADMPPNDEDVYREEEEEEEKKEDADSVEKDATTASDDAEERIEDDQPEETEEAMTMLAKALLGQLKKSEKPKRKIRKSRTFNPELIEIKKLIAGVAKMQMENADAINGILEGYGIAEKIKKSYEERTSRTRPVGSAGKDAEALKSLIDMVQKAKPEEKKEFDVRASIADVMKSITGGMK